jgi:hypothetical protein
VHCDECGFTYESVAGADVGPTLREYAGRVRVRIEPLLGDAALTRRPASDVWSVHEYACHLRDTLGNQRERVLLALVEDGPRFRPMYRDERVALAGYIEEDLTTVLDHLALNANLLAHLFERLSPEQLARACVYGYPEPTQRDVLWVGQHTVHECAHHLLDIERGLGT